MQSISSANFGPLVAYLLPGATLLYGLSPYFAMLRSWLAVNPPDSPSIGGFLYLTVASLAAGMTVSAVRWLVVDTIHACTGLRPPDLNFSRLSRNVDAYALLIELHYRHYQFYANMLVALLTAHVARRIAKGSVAPEWAGLLVLFLAAVFFVTSRDNMRKYQTRCRQLLGEKTQSLK